MMEPLDQALIRSRHLLLVGPINTGRQVEGRAEGKPAKPINESDLGLINRFRLGPPILGRWAQGQPCKSASSMSKT